MNELALFAGAGGGILGGKLLGWRTVCAVEWEPYPASVLMQRQNDGILAPFPIWDDVRTFDGLPWRGRVDVVSGGFPCQDISAAGKGAGIDGARSGMWAHMARIIGEVRPRYAFVENSPMLTSRGLGRVLGDLAALGFDARWCVLGADDAGAPHRRDRIWIAAHASRVSRDEWRAESARQLGQAGPANGVADVAHAISTQEHSERGPYQRGWISVGRDEQAAQCEDGLAGADCLNGCSENVADAKGERRGETRQLRPDEPQERTCSKGKTLPDAMRNGLQGQRGGGDSSGPFRLRSGTRSHQEQYLRHPAGSGLSHGSDRSMGRPGAHAQSQRPGWWAAEPNVGRVANGVAARVDRLKAIGNGQVSAVAALAWRVLTGTANN